MTQGITIDTYLIYIEILLGVSIRRCRLQPDYIVYVKLASYFVETHK